MNGRFPEPAASRSLPRKVWDLIFRPVFQIQPRMSSPTATQMIPAERVEKLIHIARGEKVLLDADLATLYGVTTGNLNKAVKRNPPAVPAGFHVSTFHGRDGGFDLPNWKIKAPRQPSPPPLRLYRAGRGEALQRPAK